MRKVHPRTSPRRTPPADVRLGYRDSASSLRPRARGALTNTESDGVSHGPTADDDEEEEANDDDGGGGGSFFLVVVPAFFAAAAVARWPPRAAAAAETAAGGDDLRLLAAAAAAAVPLLLILLLFERQPRLQSSRTAAPPLPPLQHLLPPVARVAVAAAAAAPRLPTAILDSILVDNGALQRGERKRWRRAVAVLATAYYRAPAQAAKQRSTEEEAEPSSLSSLSSDANV